MQAINAAFQFSYVRLSPENTGIVTLLSCFHKSCPIATGSESGNQRDWENLLLSSSCLTSTDSGHLRSPNPEDFTTRSAPTDSYGGPQDTPRTFDFSDVRHV